MACILDACSLGESGLNANSENILGEGECLSIPIYAPLHAVTASRLNTTPPAPEIIHVMLNYVRCCIGLLVC